MKTIFSSVILIFLVSNLTGQSFTDPVSWDYEIKEKDDKKELIILATIQDGWMIYSQFTPEGGPIPTLFEYDDKVVLEGKTEEVDVPIKMMDEMFEIEVLKFKKTASFLQTFTPVQKDVKSTSVDITYMSCNDKTCLPPKTITLVVNL